MSKEHRFRFRRNNKRNVSLMVELPKAHDPPIIPKGVVEETRALSIAVAVSCCAGVLAAES